MDAPPAFTILFTDIEGSTRLWAEEPGAMSVALAHHDALARTAIESNNGALVKMTGDGMHAVFTDALDALRAAIQFQQGIAESGATGSIALSVRCGMHAGPVERRDNDYFGSTVNLAARIMAAANGGQVLVSQVLAEQLIGRLPAGASLLDLGAARLRDVQSVERLYQVVHPRLRQNFPALRSLQPVPHNLPEQLTSFIGRVQELADIARLLDSSRLLTLVGAGGLGKTRLSLEAASAVREKYQDGVWLVELAAIADPRLVPQVVASVLGIKEEPGSPVHLALAKHVKDRNALLILDNCEHLVDACAELAAQLLHAGPHMQILASSREPLHVAGEATYSVPPLSVPASSDVASGAALARFDAVCMFLDRAGQALPGFRLTPRNAPEVAEICRHLDGIPLAIELAATRVRSLSISQIATHLNDQFRLLIRGDRTALPRQQTLRACIDWSFDLLTGPEKVLARRLAVFVRGWTLEAAEAVCAGGEVDRSNVFELLAHLVEKSLVIMESGGERYRFLEPVGQYMQAQLKASGEGDEIRTGHLRYFLGLAQRAQPMLVGPEQGSWLARLDAERENMLAAHAWCDRVEHCEAGLALVHRIKFYWLKRGLVELGLRVTMEALARAGAEERTIERCQALFDVGQLCLAMARYGEARDHLEQSLSLARQLQHKKRVAAALQPLGMVYLGEGDTATARALMEEAVTLATEIGNKRELLAALNDLAQIHRLNGDLDSALPLYEKVLTHARELRDGESVAITLLNLSIAAISTGAGERARELLMEAHDIVQDIGSKAAGQGMLDVSAAFAASLADWESAARFYGVAEGLTATTGLHRDSSDAAFLEPLIARTRKALSQERFAVAEENGRKLSYEDALDEVRAWLASPP